MEFFQNLDLNYILSTYGYFGILFLTFLEGETIVILAGVAAYKGLMDPKLIALCAFIGTFLSDQIMFSLGKYKGPAVLKRFPRINSKVDRASRLIQKYDTLLILGFRFVYGVRNVTPIMLGISRVSHLKFFVLNFIGAGVWAISFTAGGYFGAEVFEVAMAKFGHAVLYVLLAVAIAGGVIWFVRYRTDKASLEGLAEKGRAALERNKSKLSGQTEQEDASVPSSAADITAIAAVPAPEDTPGPAITTEPETTPEPGPVTKEQ